MTPAAHAVITYQRACASRTPKAFEAAAHALAEAVGLRPVQSGERLEMGRDAGPRLVVDNCPTLR